MTWRDALVEYYDREFREPVEAKEIPEEVGLAYTEDELGYEIQVNLNTKTGYVTKYIEGNEVDVMELDPEDLRYWGFSDLVGRW